MDKAELLKAIGFDFEDDKIDDIKVKEVKDYMTDTFIGLEIAHEAKDIIDKVLGKSRSSDEVTLKRNLKKIDLKIDDKILWKDDMIDKTFEIISTHIAELKEGAGKDNDKKLKDLNKKFDKLKDDYDTSIENNDTITKEKDQALKDKDDYITNQGLNTKTSEAWNGIEFGENVSELEVEGFKSKMGKLFKPELSDSKDDSKDGLRVIDTKTGKRVNDGKENTSYVDILKNQAKEMKILKLNNKTPIDEDKNKKKKPDLTEDQSKKVFQGAIEHAVELDK